MTSLWLPWGKLVGSWRRRWCCLLPSLAAIILAGCVVIDGDALIVDADAAEIRPMFDVPPVGVAGMASCRPAAGLIAVAMSKWEAGAQLRYPDACCQQRGTTCGPMVWGRCDDQMKRVEPGAFEMVSRSNQLAEGRYCEGAVAALVVAKDEKEGKGKKVSPACASPLAAEADRYAGASVGRVLRLGPQLTEYIADPLT